MTVKRYLSPGSATLRPAKLVSTEYSAEKHAFSIGGGVELIGPSPELIRLGAGVEQIQVTTGKNSNLFKVVCTNQFKLVCQLVKSDNK